MKNATRSVVLIFLVGALTFPGIHASRAAAQEEAGEPPAERESGDAEPRAGEDDGSAEDSATADESAAEGPEDLPETDGAELGGDAAALTAPAAGDDSTLEPSDPEEGALEPGDLDEDESEDHEDGGGAEPEPLPWRNTFFSWTNQATFNSFVRDAQLSYNPNYSQVFGLSPRWYVAPQSFFWANLSLAVELTDVDGNSLNREPQISDTILEFRQLVPWEGFVFIAQARLGFPTSLLSLAAQRYLQTGLALTAIRMIPEATLTIAAQVAYRRWWAGSNVPQVGEPQPDSCPHPVPASAPAGGGAPEFNTATCDQLGTVSAGRDILVSGVSLTATPIGGFSINLSVFFLNMYGFELAPAYVDVDTREEPLVVHDGSPTHWRNFTYIALAVGYQFLPWLNVSLGIQNHGIMASAYNDDGSIRNPIFTPDTQVFLSATLQLDSIWTEITGSGDDGLTPEERQRRRQGLASGPSSGGLF